MMADGRWLMFLPFLCLFDSVVDQWGEKFAEFIGQQEKEASFPVPVYPFLWDIVYKPIVVYCLYQFCV